MIGAAGGEESSSVLLGIHAGFLLVRPLIQREACIEKVQSEIVDIAAHRPGKAERIREQDDPGASFCIEAEKCLVASRAVVHPDDVVAIVRKNAIERNDLPPDRALPPRRTT